MFTQLQKIWFLGTKFRLRVSITITIILLGTYVSTEASFFTLYDDELLLERKIVIVRNNVIDITARPNGFRKNKRILGSKSKSGCIVLFGGISFRARGKFYFIKESEGCIVRSKYVYMGGKRQNT